jgi:hypothetical protein
VTRHLRHGVRVTTLPLFQGCAPWNTRSSLDDPVAVAMSVAPVTRMSPARLGHRPPRSDATVTGLRQAMEAGRDKESQSGRALREQASQRRCGG